MLHIQGQRLGAATLSDQMSCIQSHVLVQNLVVLSGWWGKHGRGWDQQDQMVRGAGGNLRLWICLGGKGHVPARPPWPLTPISERGRLGTLLLIGRL